MVGGLGQSRAKAVRLLTVAAALSSRPMTLEDLRAQLGLYEQAAGRTQFERDKAALADAGVAITHEDKVYRVVGRLGPRFTQREMDALVAVAGHVSDAATGVALAAFAARADAFPDPDAGGRVATRVPDAPVLIDAVERRAAVRFRYHGVHGPPGDRHVEPWLLRARRGLWYLLAWDVDRQDHRHYRLDRIEGEVVVDGAATHPRPAVLPTDLLPGASGPVTMRLGERGRFEARRQHAVLTPADDDGDAGPTVAAFGSLRDEAALGFALTHDAVILDPPELEGERRLRAAIVHDRHTMAASAPPAELDAQPRARQSLDRERLRRLLLLPAWLVERGGVTVGEVARGFGCTEEELVEDVGVLQDVTLPWTGDVFDVSLDEDGQLTCRVEAQPAVGLSALDRGRIRSLLDVSEPLLVGEREREGLAQLLRRLDQAVVAAVDPQDSLADIAALRRARAARRVVTFAYLARDGVQVEQRRVTPTELSFVDGHMYVIGWDHGRGAGRVFRLDRLADLAVGGPDEVERTLDLGVPRYVPTGEETEVVLRCTHVGTWVLARLSAERRVRLEDGTTWAVVRTDVPRLVVDLALTAAGEVEVVAPAWLRGEVATRADGVR